MQKTEEQLRRDRIIGIVLACIAVLFALSAVFIYVFREPLGLTDTGSQQTGEEYSAGVTMENFNRIKAGMTYAEVVEIFGSAGEVQGASAIGGVETTIIMWERPLYGSCNVTFSNGVVIAKAQIGL